MSGAETDYIDDLDVKEGIDQDLEDAASTILSNDESGEPKAHNSAESARKMPKGAVAFDPIQGVFLDKDGLPVRKPGRKFGPSVSRDEFQLNTSSVFERDPAALGSMVARDANGFIISDRQLAGKKQLPVNPRETFRRGTRWRVTGENVRIEAMCNYGTGANGQDIWSGFSERLPIGTELTCIGWRRFRKDGLVAPQFTYPGIPKEAQWASVWPHSGVWRPWPLEGILEEIR